MRAVYFSYMKFLGFGKLTQIELVLKSGPRSPSLHRYSLTCLLFKMNLKHLVKRFCACADECFLKSAEQNFRRNL